MAIELFLEFRDETGRQRRVQVDASPFSVGRTADNNLQIQNGSLSRRHIQIERFADVFVVTDCGSSNGTWINNTELNAPVALKNGDQLLLGGAVEISVAVEGETEYVNQNYGSKRAAASEVSNEEAPIWQSAFFIAPVFGLVVLLLLGGLFLAVKLGSSERPQNSQVNREIAEELPEENENRRSPRNRNSGEESNTNEEPPVNRQPGNSNSEPPVNSNTGQKSPSTEEETVEKHAYEFLRRASDNQNPVLSSKQVALINSKIKSLKSSSRFRENLKAAVKNQTGFDKTAQEHHLKGALLAAVALVKLGDSSGDAISTANAVAPELKNYADVLGTELANDTLLTVAAYAEGGAPNAMRDRVASLAKNTPNVTPGQVRTIWFLSENGKLNPAAFDFAVRVLAAGTIMQNPQAFGF